MYCFGCFFLLLLVGLRAPGQPTPSSSSQSRRLLWCGIFVEYFRQGLVRRKARQPYNPYSTFFLLHPRLCAREGNEAGIASRWDAPVFTAGMWWVKYCLFRNAEKTDTASHSCPPRPCALPRGTTSWVIDSSHPKAIPAPGFFFSLSPVFINIGQCSCCRLEVNKRNTSPKLFEARSTHTINT